jgi:hypothetical protein
MRRLLASLLVVLAAAAPGRAADNSLARFNVVDIKTSVASLYIASVTMIMPPFVRHNAVYASTYYAKVFPYYFFSEKGRIWIVVPEAELRRAAVGQPVDFVGHALSDSGEERKVEGHAVPTGPSGGKIRVRVFISRRISLNYDTTYELKGVPSPAVPVTAR